MEILILLSKQPPSLEFLPSHDRTLQPNRPYKNCHISPANPSSSPSDLLLRYTTEARTPTAPSKLRRLQGAYEAVPLPVSTTSSLIHIHGVAGQCHVGL
jgi:hypothetical protein